MGKQGSTLPNAVVQDRSRGPGALILEPTPEPQPEAPAAAPSPVGPIASIVIARVLGSVLSLAEMNSICRTHTERCVGSVVRRGELNVLVTGGAGLIGMNLRRELKRLGHDVCATDMTTFDREDADLVRMSLGDTAGLEALARERKVDAIVHAGAISGPMMSRDDPMRIVDTNITATAGIIDLARRLSVRRFVFCSSVGVYGEGSGEVFTEDAPLRPTSLYGASKVTGEQLLRGFAADHGLAGTSLRIARVYGPYRRGNCPIQSMLKAAAIGEEIELVGDSTFPYHFIHVDDVVQAIVRALDLQDQSGVAEFNVAAPRAQTLPEIVAAVKEVAPQLNVRIVPGENDVPDYQAGFDTTKIASALGWQASVDLVSGIDRHRSFLSSQ